MLRPLIHLRWWKYHPEVAVEFLDIEIEDESPLYSSSYIFHLGFSWLFTLQVKLHHNYRFIGE